MDIRELVGKYGSQSALWGCTLTVLAANEMGRLEKALLAAIDRLERKAATAKAESDAWREQEAAHADLITTDPEKQEAAHERINAADRAIDAARTATDEAWREPAPENKEAQQ